MRINIEHGDKITAALAAVNGRATAHVVAGWQVYRLAARAERDLESRGVPIKARRGVRVTYVPAGPGRAYARKGRSVVSTRVTIERGSRTWFLVATERYDLWADARETYTIHATEAARDAILTHALRNVSPAC